MNTHPKIEKGTKSSSLPQKNDDEEEIEDSSQENEESQENSENDVSDADLESDDGTKTTGEVLSKESSLTFVCDALCDYVGEESDLSFSKGEVLTILNARDDGWWEAENAEGKRGMVPSTFLRVPDKVKKYLEGTQVSHTSQRPQLWDQLRRMIRKEQIVDTALGALGAFSIGYFHSSLSQLLEKDPSYSTKAFLTPKLSDSGMSFDDLHWDMNSRTLRPETSSLQKVVNLVAFRQLVPPPVDYEVTSRHVRLCLHDGSKVLSNIHTIRAKWDPKSPKIWAFNQKTTVTSSILEEGQIFIRSNKSNATLGLLFELCMTFKKSDTNEYCERSCGWVFMRLLNDSGFPVPSRTKILKIHRGVAFGSQGPSSPANISALKHFMSKNKHPRMVVSISNPKSSFVQQMSYLPSTLVGPVTGIPLLALYRKILADKFLEDRISFDSTEWIQSPFLANFPQVFNEPDLLDAFRKLWNENYNIQKKEESKKITYQNLFLESVFLILQSCHMPPYSIGNLSENERILEITRQIKLIYDTKTVVTPLSPEIEYQPISIKNLTKNIIS